MAIIASIIAGSVMLVNVYIDRRKSTLHTYNQRQMILAEQVSLGLRGFFDSQVRDLSFLASIDDIIYSTPRGFQLLDDYYRTEKPLIINIGRMDRNGVLTHLYPDSDFSGSSIRHQNHIQELLKSHKPVLSDVFSTVEGHRAMSLHVPVFRNGVFDGSVNVLIPFAEISKQFLGTVTEEKDHSAVLISAGGTILYAPSEKFRDVAFSSIEGLGDDIRKTLEMMTQKGKGFSAFQCSEFFAEAGSCGIYHGAFTPVEIVNTFLAILVMSPEQEIYAGIRGFQIRILLLTMLSFIVIALTVGLLLWNRSISDEHQQLYTLAEDIQKSRERLSMIVENSPAGICVVDINGKIQFINNRFTEMFGYTIDDVSDVETWGYRAYPDEEERQKRAEQWEKGIAELTGHRDIFRTDRAPIIAKDGTLHYADIITGKLSDSILVFFDDVTETVESDIRERALQEKLVRLQKMESLGLLAGGVAHDLNNILLGILTYPDLLLRKIPRDSPLRDALITIRQSGERAAAIVQDLLTLTRGVSMRKEPVFPATLIQEYIESPEMERLLSEHAGITVTLQRKEPVSIIASPHHIRKSIMNLVVNSVEAVEKDGSVVIDVFEKELSVSYNGYESITPGRWCVIRVEDSGPGIPEESTGKIFEPFYSEKQMGKSGSGLGLTVVWNTVRDHDGYIDLESSNGTVFSLYFPLHSRSSSLNEEPEDTDEWFRGNGQMVMLVDDNPMQRNLGVDILNDMKCHALACASGEEALRRLQHEKVDLLLLDMVMTPGMSGREVMEKISYNHPNLPVIMVSGYAQDEDAERCLEMGAKMFIAKPYTIRDLSNALSAIFGDSGTAR